MATESKKVETAATETAVEYNPNAPLFILLDVDKVKAIRSTLGDRTYFESTEAESAYAQAEKYLTEAAAKLDNFHGLAVAAADGIEEASRLVIATVGVRDKGDPSKNQPARNGYKAIVIMKQPKADDFIADESEAAQNYWRKLIERETTDVQFSGIRTADSLAELQTVLAGLPDTVGGIVENARQGSGAGSSSFDEMWADFRKAWLKVKYPTLDAALPQKPDIIKAIKSKAYALANPVTRPIEENGYFVAMASVMRKMAETIKDSEGNPAPLDTSDIQAWLDGRDSNVIEFKVPEISTESLGGLKLEF